MPKCSSSISIQAQGKNRVESCSYNLFSNNSLSMVFPTTNEPITSSSPVDCTLSLGTPSTRQTSCNKGDVKKPGNNNNNSFMSNLCWSAFQTTKKTASPSAQLPPTTVGCINNNSISNGDPLLARRCANCDTTSTPLWRNGPRGPKSLCNACGIRYKKEERRATTPQTNSGGAAAPQLPPHLISHPAAWTHHHPGPSQKVLSNEFRFMEAAAAGETTNNFLSWRLNVPDHRASIVNDYTY
ncbi:Gata transcription factor [Thalictrum thalictroides]|uniref:Gata transcription factor n=1 Tax=Thalictrum thalictroides TaxID=46969 RepID=A0A7J6WBZ6_THATH|nr:Gata transcription factor [Thalictrum thalictroides]